MKLVGIFKSGVILVFILLIISMDFGNDYIVGNVKGDKMVNITFDMETQDDIILTTISSTTEIDAINYRINIDSVYGNNDGDVNQTEVDNYKNSLQQQVVGLGQTQNTFVDYKSLTILYTVVNIYNATGTTNNTQPVHEEYKSGLKTTTRTPDAIWHTIVLKGEYYSNNTITLKAPEGWRVAQNPKNFIDYQYSADSRQIQGRVKFNYDVEIKIYDPSRMEDSGSKSGRNELLTFIANNYIIFIPIFLFAGIYLILSARGDKKRQLKKSSAVGNSKTLRKKRRVEGQKSSSKDDLSKVEMEKNSEEKDELGKAKKSIDIESHADKFGE
ncbi:MAG: hypothetical protein JSV49_10165 [Thermoplasmata archaeon]|nr:MAG: hypothetical protein JSV49_10165 [Thermoplasmata archaeon]